MTKDSLKAALKKCRDQFQFYANEHVAAAKLEKAATNQRFADMCDAALRASTDAAPVAGVSADLLTKAVGDITAALIMAGKQDKVCEWTAPYVAAINEHDAHPPVPDAAGEGLVGPVQRFLADYDDGDRADAGVNPLMEAHIADFRAALSHPAPAEPSKDTVAFVQEWMMSGDHEADQWHKDFAAAIDARANVVCRDQFVKHMVDRFLSWKLPADFSPDGGVLFDPIANKGTRHEYRREPVGTNLLTAAQAEEMVRHLVDGAALAQPPAAEPVGEDEEGPCTDCYDTGVTIQTERRCACQPPIDQPTDKRSQLAELIRTRLLGVDPDDQDLQLEDDDWRLILAALATGNGGEGRS